VIAFHLRSGLNTIVMKEHCIVMYRTVSGHNHAADEQLSGVYGPGVDTGRDHGGSAGLYQPRKLLADFYRHRERLSYQQKRETAGDLGRGEEVHHQGDAGGRLVKSASDYDASPPADDKATNYLHGRRQTWPLGGTSAALPMVRRRAQQDDQSYLDYDDEEDVDRVVDRDGIVDRDRRSAIIRESAAAAAAAAAASPISRLIQRYDQLTSSATAGGDAFPVPVATQTPPAGGRADWGFPSSLPWQPAAMTTGSGVDGNSSSTENSSSAISDHGTGETIKTYSCHICSYIGR